LCGEDYYLREQVKTIKNLCDIALVLQNVGRNELMPTVLELILVESQDLVDSNCVVDTSQTSQNP